MVHVNAESLKSEAQWLAGTATALPPSYSLPDLPPSDSFDHIDQLLDGTIQIRRVKRSSGAARWRTGSERSEGLAEASTPPTVKPVSPLTRAVSLPPSQALPGDAAITGTSSPAPSANVAQVPRVEVSTRPTPASVPSESRWSLGDEIREEMAAAAERSPTLPQLHPAARVISNVSAGPLPVWSDEPITQEDVAFLTRNVATSWWRTNTTRSAALIAAAAFACGGAAFWMLRDSGDSDPPSQHAVVNPQLAVRDADLTAEGDAEATEEMSSGETPSDELPATAGTAAETDQNPANSAPETGPSETNKQALDQKALAQHASDGAGGNQAIADKTTSADPSAAAPQLDASNNPPEAAQGKPAPGEDAPADKQQPIADDELSQLARWLKQPSTPAGSPHVANANTNGAVPPVAERISAAPSDSEEPVVLVPTRPLPPRVDVDSRLKMSLSACRFQGTPLVEVLRSLSDLSTIPITLDPDALGRVRQRCDRPVQLDLRQATLRSVLEGSLREAKLGYEVREGQLRIVTADEQSQTMVSVRHDVSDLTKGEPRAAQALANWIKQLIAFGSWQSQVKADVDNDADSVAPNESLSGTIEVEGATLQVVHRDAVQFQIVALLDKLRVARGLTARGELLDEHVRIGGVTGTFSGFDRPITIRSWRGVGLHEILQQIEEQAEVRILVDWESLHAMGWAPGDEWKFFCRETSLRKALPRLLSGTGLSYRIVDSRTLQIVSMPTLLERHDVEVYSLRREGLNAASVQKFCVELAQQLGRDKFQPQGPGALAYDAQSQHLVVSLPQRDQETVQARIVEWLAQP